MTIQIFSHMEIKIANTIQLTTKCSGGCLHCPFSFPNMEKLFLSRGAVKKIISKSEGALSVLSGGEPFEHPEISKILVDLQEQEHPFRIATGGFVDLMPWIEKLRSICLANGPFKGISIGTDVLSSRVSHSDWIPIWKSNIHLITKFQIPFSLTFTIDNDLEFVRLNLWKWTEFFEGKPEFIYLRYPKHFLIGGWVSKICNTFGTIPIIHDDFL